MASVSVVLRKEIKNKKGESPINFFVIKDRKLSKVATGILLLEKHWDSKNKRVKSSHPNSSKMNSLISNKFTELQDNVLENETIAKSLTSRQLRDTVFGQKPVDIFEFSNGVLKDYLRNGQIGTHDRCKAIMNKLKNYVTQSLKYNTLHFQEITPEFLIKYEHYLRDKLENKTNSIHGNMKYISKLFNDVIRLDIVDSKHNPFKKYKLKTEKTQRVFLTEDELDLIAKVDCSSYMKLELHRDMFVFSAYAGGLRISDLLQLKWQNLDGKHIHFIIKKTNSQISIMLPDVAISIIEKYKPDFVDGENYIFPMLPNGLKENNLRLLDNEISCATAYINKNLKLLAQKAKINKLISFHTSRHTFATRALRKGMRIEYVSKLMGHSAIKETQIYAKIVNEELDKAMDVFNEKPKLKKKSTKAKAPSKVL